MKAVLQFGNFNHTNLFFGKKANKLHNNIDRYIF